MDRSTIKVKSRIKDILERFDLLSVNQTSAQIKLLGVWKNSKDSEYPKKFLERIFIYYEINLI